MESQQDVKVETPTEEKPVETPAEETPVSEASTEKETVSKEVPEAPETPEKAEKPSEAEELTEEERKKLSVKAQRRYTDLSKKAKRADELEKEVGALRQQQDTFMAGLGPKVPTEPTYQAPPKLPWETEAEAGGTPEISPEDYKRDVLTTSDWLVQTRIAQARRLDAREAGIKEDLRQIQETHEELNPKSDKYDEELSKKLAGLFNQQLRANPDARLQDFIGTVMSVRQGGEDKGKQETTAKLATQKAEEALTPSEAEVEDIQKPFEEMDLQEQEKYLKDHGLWE